MQAKLFEYMTPALLPPRFSFIFHWADSGLLLSWTHCQHGKSYTHAWGKAPQPLPGSMDLESHVPKHAPQSSPADFREDSLYMIYPSEDNFYLLLFFPLSVAVELSLNLDSDTSLHKCSLHWRENNWALLLAGLLWHCHPAPTHALSEGRSLHFVRSQPPLCKPSTCDKTPAATLAPVCRSCLHPKSPVYSPEPCAESWGSCTCPCRSSGQLQSTIILFSQLH